MEDLAYKSLSSVRRGQCLAVMRMDGSASSNAYPRAHSRRVQLAEDDRFAGLLVRNETHAVRTLRSELLLVIKGLALNVRENTARLLEILFVEGGGLLLAECVIPEILLDLDLLHDHG